MDSLLAAYDKIKSILYSIQEFQNEDIEVEDTIKELTDLILSLENGGTNEEKKKPAQKSRKRIKKDTVTDKIKSEDVQADVTIIKEEKGNVEERQQMQIESNQSNEIKTKQDSSKKTENSIRVDVERLDDLLNIVSELVLGRNRLAQVNSEFALENEGTKFSRDLFDATKQIDLMTNELQLVVMKTRMIKIGKVFNKFPRLVRDLSRDAKKQMNIVIIGEETELDKTLIEEINDPLVHLIRNSVDHGIEDPETRKANGKNPTGTLELSAQHDGNNIIIQHKR